MQIRRNIYIYIHYSMIDISFDSLCKVLSSSSLAELMVSERIQEFCTRECLFVCGAGAAGPHSSWCEHMQSILESILPHCNTPTFLCFEPAGLQKRRVAAFEWSEGGVLQVAPSFAKAPKEHIFNCIWESDLATNPLQKLMTKVCDAVVAKSSAQIPAGTQAQLQEHFRRIEVPADGLCGWHCINAIEDLEAWQAIPRNAGQYAVNKAVQKAEERKARRLCAQVCEQCCHPAHQTSLREPKFWSQRPPLDYSGAGHCNPVHCGPEGGVATAFKMYIYIYTCFVSGNPSHVLWHKETPAIRNNQQFMYPSIWSRTCACWSSLYERICDFWRESM